MCPDVPLCSNNRSNGKLGITFHHFSVDKYTKESRIVRIRGDVGKNFQVSDCGLRLRAKQALSVINLFKVIWSTRIMCRAELLFYYVPSVLLLPVIKRWKFLPTSPRILTIQLSFAYLSTEKRWKVIPNLPFDLLFEHKSTWHTEIFVWHDL